MDITMMAFPEDTLSAMAKWRRGGEVNCYVEK